MIHEFGNQSDNLGMGGTPWQRGQDFRTDVERDHPNVQLHNPESADLATAMQLAREQIAVSGANVLVYIRASNPDRDYVWDEDPNPLYYSPVRLKAFFKPQPLEAELKRWGVDIVNQAEIIFAVQDLHEQWADRMLRAGDVIEVPYNSPNQTGPRYYRIKNASPSGNFRYSWLYYTCMAETLSADATVRVTDDMADNSMEDNDRGEYNGSL